MTGGQFWESCDKQEQEALVVGKERLLGMGHERLLFPACCRSYGCERAPGEVVAGNKEHVPAVRGRKWTESCRRAGWTAEPAQMDRRAGMFSRGFQQGMGGVTWFLRPLMQKGGRERWIQGGTAEQRETSLADVGVSLSRLERTVTWEGDPLGEVRFGERVPCWQDNFCGRDSVTGGSHQPSGRSRHGDGSPAESVSPL